MIMLQAVIAYKYLFFCIREISDFLVSLSGCIWSSTCLYHWSNRPCAVLAERVLPPLRLVRTVRRMYSFQACMDVCKPVCTII